MAKKRTTRRKRRPDSVLDVLARYGLPDDFPLSPHLPTNRWYRKIKGRRHYFGPLDDPQAALNTYLDTRDDLLAGRTPGTKRDGVSVRQVLNAWLASKDRARQSGELHQATFDAYLRGAELIRDGLGASRRVVELTPRDFSLLRSQFAKRYGPAEVGKHVGFVRSAFKYAWESELIDKPMRFGPEFKKPARSAQRRVRQSKPERMLEAEQVRTLIKAASCPMDAMILLGINCGLGNTDVANLPKSALDLDAGVASYPRPKTAIERRAILWPETVAALRQAIEHRPAPKADDDAGLVFITKYGKRWVRHREAGSKRLRPREGEEDKPIRRGLTDSVSTQFDKLLNDNGMKAAGVGFYALRHTFQTIAEGCRDFPAIERIMGHADASMAERYRERIDDDRLRAVADHVHQWLFGKPAKRSRGKG